MLEIIHAGQAPDCLLFPISCLEVESQVQPQDAFIDASQTKAVQSLPAELLSGWYQNPYNHDPYSSESLRTQLKSHYDCRAFETLPSCPVSTKALLCSCGQMMRKKQLNYMLQDSLGFSPF